MTKEEQIILGTSQIVFDEVDKALMDKNRTIKDSNISNLLNGTLQVDNSTSYSNTVGLYLIAPNPISWAKYIIDAIRKFFARRKLEEYKEIIYKEVIKKQNMIIEALVQEREADKKRIEYLTALNKLLSKMVDELGANA